MPALPTAPAYTSRVSTDLAADLAIAQHARFEKLWAGINKRQRRLVEKTLRDVEKDLAKAKPGSWTAASSASTLVQLAQSVKGLSERQLQLLRRALPGVAKRAQKDTAAWLRELDESFLGSSTPMRWDTLEWLDGYSRPLLRSRLRVYRQSFARYGAAAVSGIEDAIAQKIMIGMPWTEAREEVMDIVREQVGGRTWMVDRIVRTEAATINSSVTMHALLEEDEPDDRMLKKLVATFDMVTAEDSRLLHGQTRKLNDLFTDVISGRKFDAPPNRPNDREIVVGWRRSWGDDRSFDADTAEEHETASSG